MQYQIDGDQLISELAGSPFAVQVYQVDGQYIAARDNEFGFANYLVEPQPQ